VIALRLSTLAAGLFVPASPLAELVTLASAGATWHSAGMSQPTRSSAAGGFFIAAGALGGTVVGLVLRQPSLGFLGGLAIGAGIALAVWLIDRRRRGE
jgi:uncharacterized membrane protein